VNESITAVDGQTCADVAAGSADKFGIGLGGSDELNEADIVLESGASDGINKVPRV
jgi:hypothetical protein